MKTKFLLFGIFFLALSCSKDKMNFEEPEVVNTSEFQLRKMDGPIDKVKVDFTNRRSSSIHSKMTAINEALEAQGLSFQLDAIESFSADGAGTSVFFNDRGNKQLGADWVPSDPRRGGYSDIAYAQDGVESATASGLSLAETTEAIDNSMGTWDNISCSQGLEIFNLGVAPFDAGFVQFLLGFGGAPFIIFGVTHAGFSTALTDFLFGVGNNVLAFTVTFGFTGTDLDNNGKADVAFREIYYNDAFNWVTDGDGIDLETVSLHEAGHGLSQGHFGKLFRTESNEKFHFAPRALMNAGYTGVPRSVEKTDKAGHCSNWSNWPNN